MSLRASRSRSPRRLLGAHVLHRADREPGSRQAIPTGFGERERDAEVRDQRLAVVQEDVLGLDVAMDDALPVCVVERAGDLSHDSNRLVHRQQLSRVSRSRSDSPCTSGMT